MTTHATEYRKSSTHWRLIQSGLQTMLEELDPNEFQLFHLTLTYRPYQDRIYDEKDISNFFTSFHLKSVLPDIFQTRTWTTKKKLEQPIVLAFVDEHLQTPTTSVNPQDHGLPSKLHHHAIIASRSRTLDFYQKRVGVNTMLPYSKKIMTSDLKPCGPDRVQYASKMIWKYPDYLTFGRQ
ncbi:hypothetical protein ACFQNJ_15025 [Hydrogenophaga bisanensis]|uniref:Uncharacterized protein n=1 Tax=Hydrogenophaga bisanensis TaxID=439611 RepID=A0ABW2RCM9_9BURK